MVDYMRVCSSSSLLSLKALASDYDDFFSEMDQAYAGTQRTTTIYTGLNQASIVSLGDGLEPYLAETGQSLETVFGMFSLSLIANILNQSGFPHQCFTVVCLYTN